MKIFDFLRFGVHAAEAGCDMKGCTLHKPAKLQRKERKCACFLSFFLHLKLVSHPNSKLIPFGNNFIRIDCKSFAQMLQYDQQLIYATGA